MQIVPTSAAVNNSVGSDQQVTTLDNVILNADDYSKTNVLNRAILRRAKIMWSNNTRDSNIKGRSNTSV